MSRRLQHRFANTRQAKKFFNELLQLASDKKKKMGIQKIYNNNRKVAISSSCSESFTTVEEEWEELKNQFYEKNRKEQNYDPGKTVADFMQSQLHQQQPAEAYASDGQIEIEKTKDKKAEILGNKQLDHGLQLKQEISQQQQQQQLQQQKQVSPLKHETFFIDQKLEAQYYSEIVNKLISGKNMLETFSETVANHQLNRYFMRLKDEFTKIYEFLSLNKKQQKSQDQLQKQQQLRQPQQSHKKMKENSGDFFNIRREGQLNTRQKKIKPRETANFEQQQYQKENFIKLQQHQTSSPSYLKISSATAKSNSSSSSKFGACGHLNHSHCHTLSTECVNNDDDDANGKNSRQHIQTDSVTATTDARQEYKGQYQTNAKFSYTPFKAGIPSSSQKSPFQSTKKQPMVVRQQYSSLLFSGGPERDHITPKITDQLYSTSLTAHQSLNNSLSTARTNQQAQAMHN